MKVSYVSEKKHHLPSSKHNKIRTPFHKLQITLISFQNQGFSVSFSGLFP